ncbi:MAG: NUDIX domain-containing protein [Patescibacteria group bacterium]
MEEDKTKHFVGKIAQKAIIVRDKKIFVMKGIGDEIWEFPGGRLHAGEEPIDGLKRELTEELGVEVQNLKPFWFGRSLHTKTNTWRVLAVWLGALPKSAKLKVAKAEVQECKWITLAELKKLPMYEDCGRAAKAYVSTIQK